VAAPFRFALQFWNLPADRWIEDVRAYEEMGFSCIQFTDHLMPQWEPVVAAAAIAAVTTTMRVGTLVLNADFRNPAILAKSAATIEILSGGRFEFGVGAGWATEDYRAAGIEMLPPRVRIEKLAEVMEIITRIWADEVTTFRGAHFHLEETPRTLHLPVRPRILMGGGSPRVVGLAGKWADTVSLIPRLTSGDWIWQEVALDSTDERMAQKRHWAEAGAQDAGRTPDDLEFNTMVYKVAVDTDPRGLQEALCQETDLSGTQITDSSLFLTGTPAQVRDRLERRRQATGLSYYSIHEPEPDQIRAFAEGVVEPLAGN